jgi:hypothetical protein
MLAEYDFVIHLHPDVYITDDSKLIQLIRAHRSGARGVNVSSCLSFWLVSRKMGHILQFCEGSAGQRASHLRRH